VNRVDEKLWESSNNVIHRQLDAHCDTSSCPCAQKIWSRFSGAKNTSSHEAMTEVCSKRNILDRISVL
jgi:hypothetical protein